MRLERTVYTPRTPTETFTYLADFTSTNEWDPGTVSTTRTSPVRQAEVRHRH